MRKGRPKQEHYEPRPFIQCAHIGCTESAILRRDVKGIELKLCKTHDLFHVQQESNEFCRELDLETYAQKRDWILAKLASPRPSPTEYWEKVMITPGLIPLAYEYARKYLNRHGTSRHTINPTAFTTPIEDEETEAAFRAYLAETAIPESKAPPE